MGLQELREEINGIDREIVTLYRKRLETAEAIGAWKRENGVQVYDPARERQLLDEVADALRGGMARVSLRIPAGDGKGLARVFAGGHVLEQKFRAGYAYLEVAMPAALAAGLPAEWIRRPR